MRALKHAPFPTRRRLSQRTIVISLLVVMLVTLAVYIVFSMRAWDDQDQLVKTSRAELKSSIETLLIKPGVASLEQKSSSTETAPEASNTSFSAQDQIKTILSDYQATVQRDDACSLAAVFEWQAGLWFMNERRQNCEASNSAARETVAALQKLYDATESLQAAESSLATTLTATASPQNFTDAATRWTELAQSISGNTPLPTSVRESIVRIATDIAAAFTGLQAANETEDKAAFDTALEQLNTQYAQLKTIQATTQESQQPLIDAVVRAYATL